MARKTLYLSESAWKTIPWLKIPKTPKDYLIDAFVDIPTLLEEVDCLRQAGTDAAQTTKTMQSLMGHYARIDRALRAWLADMAPLEELSELRARGFSHPTLDDIAVAHTMTLFWACCILTYSTAHLARATCRSVAWPAPPGPHTNPRPYCEQVAELCDVFFQPEARAFGLASAPFPLGIALAFVMSTEGMGSPLASRLVGYFSRSAGGSSTGKFLLSTLRDFSGPPLVSGEEKEPEV
jgi:hypothetical protein